MKVSTGEGKAGGHLDSAEVRRKFGQFKSVSVVSLVKKTGVLEGGKMIATVWLCLGQTTWHTIVWCQQ